MSTIGDGLGRAAKVDLGVGYPMPPQNLPQVRTIVYDGFAGGFVQPTNPSAAQPNQSIDQSDMEPTRDGLVRISPGLRVGSGTAQTDVLLYIFNQYGLDFAPELICIAPPNVGVKLPGGDFAFTAHAIGATGVFGWNAMNFEDFLLFSNGTNVTYTREAGAGTIADISADIVARTFATIFGRVFAGGYTDGSYQALGIKWNGSSGDIDDWAGADSGAELLIADTQQSDRIVALRALGFDALAILCRNSLWAGYPTQQDNRPADFRIRFTGIGCVAEPTAVITPGGITFLSDEGIVNYNISEATVISEPVNGWLLPLDFSRISEYRACYDPTRQRYVLTTPVETLIYEFPRGPQSPGRWYRRALSGTDAPDPATQDFQVMTVVAFSDQDDSDDESAKLFAALKILTGIDIGKYYLAFEDTTRTKILDFTLPTPYWITPNDRNVPADSWVTTTVVRITYRSDYSSITALRVNPAVSDGALGAGTNFCRVIATDGGFREVTFERQMTGRGTGLIINLTRLDSGPGVLEIARIEQDILDYSPREASTTSPT